MYDSDEHFSLLHLHDRFGVFCEGVESMLDGLINCFSTSLLMFLDFDET